MAQDQSVLFSPLTIGNLQVNGRVFKTATSETRATEDGFVSDELLEFYEPMVQAGTPLIVTGNLYVTQEGKSTFRMCGADADDKIPGLARWASLAHSGGSALFGQINHCGRQVFAKGMGLDQAVSASDVMEKVMGTKPRPLKEHEVREAVAAYAKSAEICQKAGFDGIQIHAGHGYLISQFLTPYTNRRTDKYGGSFFKRMRFLLEVYFAIRKRCGEDYPLILKINGTDYLPARKGLSSHELVEVARILQEEGLNGVEVTVGHYESGFPMMRGTFSAFFKAMSHEGLGDQLPWVRRAGLKLFWPPIAFTFDQLWPPQEGFNLRYAANFKKKLKIPVICVGGFQTRARMEAPIQSGVCDAVSCARAMIADPYLFLHLRQNVTGPQCNWCNGCIGRAGRLPVDCYDPVIGKQRKAMIQAQGQG